MITWRHYDDEVDAMRNELTSNNFLLSPKTGFTDPVCIGNLSSKRSSHHFF